MLTTLAAGAGHPAVAGLLGLGAAGLAAVVVAMAWSVHTRQFRLAEHLARRQFLMTGDTAAAGEEDGLEVAFAQSAAAKAPRANGVKGPPPVVIEGPATVIAGEQARFRVPVSGAQKVVSWAAGGGALAQAPDPAHPGDLLLVADEPGDLTVTVWVREGINERRATKSITAVPDAAPPGPPFTIRLFLQAWGLVVVAVLIIGFAGALVALGSLGAADFIALVAPLAALLAVIAVARGQADAVKESSFCSRSTMSSWTASGGRSPSTVNSHSRPA